jgi:DNA polymerase III delta prime subunit
MNESKDYQPNLSRGILLLGQPGMGKTTTALQIAKPVAYIADCDNNLSGATRFLSGTRFLYDTPDIGYAPDYRFEELSRRVKEASQTDIVGTLILDSLTKVADYVMDEILRQQNRKTMQLQDWGTFLNVMKRTITMLRSTRKLFIATAHIKSEKDEVAGYIKFFPALPGQIQHIIGALFSDVWLCDCEEKGGKHNYIIRTMPTTFYALKNSLGLPSVCTAEQVKEALNK